MNFRLIVCVLLAVGMAAGADTVYLSNGVRVDGVVKQRPDGNYVLEVRGREIVYRPSEIVEIEKNDRTGERDLDAIRARVEARRQELLEQTGLTQEQRDRVDELIVALSKAEQIDRPAIKNRLVRLQAEMNVARYLEWKMREVIEPWVLEAYYYVAPAVAEPVLRRGTQDTNHEVRSKAIELLGRVGNDRHVDMVVRGLADHKSDVQIEAAYALARLGAREATPALIEMLGDANVRVSNASRQALEALWDDASGDAPPETVQAWEELWAQQAGQVDGSFQLARLQPLIPPEEEMVFE